MSQSKPPSKPGKGPGLPPDVLRNGGPGWAVGLRKLYKSVVDEPLPSSFDDLLKKLDEPDDER